MAQLLHDLLKRESLIKFGNKKNDEKLEKDVEDFIKKHLTNLLLSVMGERNEVDFSTEEALILKQWAQKLKATSIGLTEK
jgi:hypothetical protein